MTIKRPSPTAKAAAHLFDLGPARAADLRSGSTVSLLTDGAERVALYRQTFLAPTAAAFASPALVLALLAVVIDPLPCLVLLVAVVLVPGFIIALHLRVRRSSSGSRRARTRLAGAYLDAIQGLTTLTLARAASRTASRSDRHARSPRHGGSNPYTCPAPSTPRRPIAPSANGSPDTSST